MRRFLFVVLPLAFALPVCAQTQTQRRTVLDYFKMLPTKKFFNMGQHPLEPRLRMKELKQGFDPTIPADNRSVVDLKNDFMRFPGDGAQSGLDVAVFRFHGRDTVAVRERYGADQLLTFWREQNGRLREVTKSVFPYDYAGEAFEVPRYGTTIQVLKTGRDFLPTSKVLARFLWRGGRFVRA